jgi:hypothetical protein
MVESWRNLEQACPNATAAMNLHTSHPALNHTLCGNKLVPNNLSYGIAEICSSLIDYFELG